MQHSERDYVTILKVSHSSSQCIVKKGRKVPTAACIVANESSCQLLHTRSKKVKDDLGQVGYK